MAQIRKYTKEEIAEMLENSTLENVAARLKEDNDGSRGLSEKSLKRFCREEGILQNNTWSDHDIDEVVLNATMEVTNMF